MKILTMMALGAGLAAGSVGTAQAMPAGASPLGGAPLVERVADGCGPGSFRGPRGFCRPMGGRFYGPPPRRFYGGYGPRRFDGGYGPRRFRGGYGPRPYYRF